MDGTRFDALARTLTAPRSRRATLGGLAAGLLLALGLALDETAVLAKKKNGKGNGKGKGGNKNQKPCSFGRPRCGGECCILGEGCRNNRCVHHCRDRRLDGGESDTDCGRACVGFLGAAGRCGLRKRCAVDDDCASGRCREPQPGQGLRCVECESDSHCTSPDLSRCLDNFCSECFLDDDCPNPSNAGFGFDRCVVIDDCPRNQPCVCRECRQDGDCPQGRPRCDTGTDPITGKFCAECLEDAHCTDSARPHCVPPEGSLFFTRRCVECLEDEHCTDSARPRCRDKHCLQCVQDTDCPQGQLCDQDRNRCEGFECDGNQDCPTGVACVDGACTGTCQPPGPCPTCANNPDVSCCNFLCRGVTCCDFGQVCDEQTRTCS